MTTTQEPIMLPSAADEMYWYLFITALEGGIGYWSVCSEYHHSHDRGFGSEDWKGFRATVHLHEDEDVDGTYVASYVIDRKVIARGYELAARTPEGLKLRWSTERPPFIITQGLDWDFDADDADMIVQLGLFGRVIYG